MKYKYNLTELDFETPGKLLKCAHLSVSSATPLIVHNYANLVFARWLPSVQCLWVDFTSPQPTKKLTLALSHMIPSQSHGSIMLQRHKDLWKVMHEVCSGQ